MNDEGIETVANRIQTEFQTFGTKKRNNGTMIKPNPLWWFIRIPALILAIILAILTIIFSFIASFVWNPDKKRENLLK